MSFIPLLKTVGFIISFKILLSSKSVATLSLNDTLYKNAIPSPLKHSKELSLFTNMRFCWNSLLTIFSMHFIVC